MAQNGRVHVIRCHVNEKGMGMLSADFFAERIVYFWIFADGAGKLEI